MRTHWNQGKMMPLLCRLPPNLTGKKQGTLSARLGLPIGCVKFLFPKEFVLAWADTCCKEHCTYLLKIEKVVPY